MPCGWCLRKKQFDDAQTHTQRRANPTGWNATDTGDSFTLNAMICNGLITCLYFGWFLSTRRSTQYAEVMWFLVDAVLWSEWMEGKKIVDLTFGIVTEKQTEEDQMVMWFWMEAVKKATRQDKHWMYLLFLGLGVEHLRVTNYVVNVLNERYKYDSLIDTNHKL